MVIMFYGVLLLYCVALNRIQCNVSVFVCISQFLEGSNGLIMRGKKNYVLNGNKVPLFRLDEILFLSLLRHSRNKKSRVHLDKVALYYRLVNSYYNYTSSRCAFKRSNSTCFIFNQKLICCC